MGAKDHRKVFISFLGTSVYAPVRYYMPEQDPATAPQLHYVQEALFRSKLSQDWHSERDAVYVFTTEQAYQSNYAARLVNAKTKESLENEGLEATFKKLREQGLISPFFPIPIPNGNSEEEIWDIFKRMFDCIEEGDEIYIDITYALRYLPMLGTTLLQYAKIVKKAEIKAIYYGNYEAGKSAHAEQDLSEDEPIRVPIFNMRSFTELQDWAEAVGHFDRSGTTDALQERIKDLIFSGQVNSDQARVLRNLGNQLNHFSKSIATCRGVELCEELQISELNETLKDSDMALIRQLEPLVELISKKMQHFQNENGIEHAFQAVRWCIDHNLLQQGITILQEGVISFLLEQIGMPWQCKEFEEYAWVKYHRELAASALAYSYKLQSPRQPPRWTWPRMPQGMHDGNERIAAVMEHPLTAMLCRSHSELSKLRNDINHAGFLCPKTSTEFEEVLCRCLSHVERSIYGNTAPAEDSRGY